MQNPKVAVDEGIAMHRKRIVIILNPLAGSRRQGRLRAVIAKLRQYGAEVRVETTTAVGDATRFAQQITANDCDVVVAAGGDGTINEVANGLVGSQLPLAIIPLGTANVLAAEIGLAADAASLARTILDGPAILVHPGIANGRHFLLMAGVGFDAEVVSAVTARLKRWLGKSAYVMQSFCLLLRYDYPLFHLTIDGRRYDACSAIIAKGRFYAGRHICAPDGSLAKPRFEVCIFKRSGPLAVISYGAALLFGRLPYHPHVLLVSGQQIRVEGPPAARVQGDGDAFGTLPLSIGLAPTTLALVTPTRWS
jgi:diacylglycerol kinase (ATP)